MDINIIKGRFIKEFAVACVYAACRELCVPRTIEEIVKVANADKVFSGKCYRLLVRELKINLPAVDFSSYLSRISNNANISEKTTRLAAEMIWVMKDNPNIIWERPKCHINCGTIWSMLTGRRKS